jgi:hypothetical protein
MAKSTNQPKPAEKPASDEAQATNQPKPAAELSSVGIVTPENRVWSVQIPRCLLGMKFVHAASESQALAKYKAVCGITAHAESAIVKPTDLDHTNLPEGIELFGE